MESSLLHVCQHCRDKLHARFLYAVCGSMLYRDRQKFAWRWAHKMDLANFLGVPSCNRSTQGTLQAQRHKHNWFLLPWAWEAGGGWSWGWRALRRAEEVLLSQWLWGSMNSFGHGQCSQPGPCPTPAPHFSGEAPFQGYDKLRKQARSSCLAALAGKHCREPSSLLHPEI